MTTYAIGSVQGCYPTLLKLLDKIAFDPDVDHLWFVGNLVNGGPDTLAVLRWVKSLGNRARMVLGPQELHLFRVANGYIQAEASDSFAELLHAPDCEELLKWLRRRPLIHHDAKLNFTLVHAGIPAAWSFSQALTFAYEVESVIAQSNPKLLLENLTPDQSRWHAKLRGWKRLRFITNACTLMKYCTPEGKLDFVTHGPVAAQSELVPWYRLPERLTAQLNIIFADVADFQDAPFPGIYPLSAQTHLSALKLTADPELMSVERVGAKLLCV